MKRLLILLFALVAFAVRTMAGLETDIAQTNRAILSAGRWTPSAQDVRKALVAIQAFLERPTSTNEWTKGEIKKILAHSKEYRVQFIGVVRDGKRLIWCNFFPLRDGFEYWKREEVRVMDGGFWFWQIEYEPSTGKCLDFISNGYA